MDSNEFKLWSIETLQTPSLRTTMMPHSLLCGREGCSTQLAFRTILLEVFSLLEVHREGTRVRGNVGTSVAAKLPRISGLKWFSVFIWRPISQKTSRGAPL